MAYVIPPWLQPVSPVQPFLSGVSQGADIAGQQNRMELAIQEMTLRREAQQRHDEAQQLAAARTVQDMAAQQQVMQQKAQEAALKWQGQKEYGDLVAQGVSPEEAFGRTAHKLMPTHLGQFIGDQIREKRLAQSQKQYGEIKRMDLTPEIEVVYREGSPGLHVVKKGTTPGQLTPKQVVDINMAARRMMQVGTSELPNDPQVQERQAFAKNIIEQYPIPNAPKAVPTMEPWDKYAPTPNVLDTMRRQTEETTGIPTKRVRVRSKSGKIGTIPESQLDQALKEGYTLAE